MTCEVLSKIAFHESDKGCQSFGLALRQYLNCVCLEALLSSLFGKEVPAEAEALEGITSLEAAFFFHALCPQDHQSSSLQIQSPAPPPPLSSRRLPL